MSAEARGRSGDGRAARTIPFCAAEGKQLRGKSGPASAAGDRAWRGRGAPFGSAGAALEAGDAQGLPRASGWPGRSAALEALQRLGRAFWSRCGALLGPLGVTPVLLWSGTTSRVAW